MRREVVQGRHVLVTRGEGRTVQRGEPMGRWAGGRGSRIFHGKLTVQRTCVNVPTSFTFFPAALPGQTLQDDRLLTGTPTATRVRRT